jgi:hypothetical protein
MDRRHARIHELAHQLALYRQAESNFVNDFTADTILIVSFLTTIRPDPPTSFTSRPYPQDWAIDRPLLNRAVRELLDLTEPVRQGSAFYDRWLPTTRPELKITIPPTPANPLGQRRIRVPTQAGLTNRFLQRQPSPRSTPSPPLEPNLESPELLNLL